MKGSEKLREKLPDYQGLRMVLFIYLFLHFSLYLFLVLYYIYEIYVGATDKMYSKLYQYSHILLNAYKSIYAVVMTEKKNDLVDIVKIDY